MGHYILDENHQPVEADMMTWARWFADDSNRRVAEDFTGFYILSSVFLGIDHNFGWKGPPLLFETMVFLREAEIKLMFGKHRPVNEEAFELGDTCWRYSSWDDCATQHQTILRRLQKLESDALLKNVRRIQNKSKTNQL
ncbi:MAG TPA: hypothetical protein VK602_00775 [Phyllobacterium sp.]|nr:hypothetical protein [Phyllobacterium sp.]